MNQPAPATTPAIALTRVPFVDLQIQNQQVMEEVRRGFDRVLSSGGFVLGPEVESFEQKFAEYCGVAHCVGVGNGTDAVELAVRALAIGVGDEVILPANTFVATAEAVLRAGADVVLVDCDDDFLIDPEAAAAAVTSRTRAVVGVHLYGQMAPMARLRALVPDDVHLIEDAAQSQGARSHGQASGSVGDVAATSFYPGKNLGAFGDAGAVLTDSDEIAAGLRRLRNHGGERRYEHEVLGMNSRLDGLQGVVLAAKLDHLDRWNRERQEAAGRYEQLLTGLAGCILPREADGNEHVWHLYVVRVPRRDHVIAQLGDEGVGTGIHYPTPLHLLPAFGHLGLGTPGAFPRSEAMAHEILSLPMFPGITSDQQERTAAVLREALSSGS